MSALTLDQEQIELVKEAVSLIRQKNDLKTQKTQVQTDIAAFKIVHAASIAADNWVVVEFQQAAQLLERLQNINSRLPAIKARLQTIKTALTNVVYKADVQTEIDSI